MEVSRRVVVIDELTMRAAVSHDRQPKTLAARNQARGRKRWARRALAEPVAPGARTQLWLEVFDLSH